MSNEKKTECMNGNYCQSQAIISKVKYCIAIKPICEFAQCEAKAPRPQDSSGSAELNCSVARHWVETFIGKLIDECEGDTITEEYLQARYAEFLKKYNLID